MFLHVFIAYFKWKQNSNSIISYLVPKSSLATMYAQHQCLHNLPLFVFHYYDAYTYCKEIILHYSFHKLFYGYWGSHRNHSIKRYVFFFHWWQVTRLCYRPFLKSMSVLMFYLFKFFWCGSFLKSLLGF